MKQALTLEHSTHNFYSPEPVEKGNTVSLSQHFIDPSIAELMEKSLYRYGVTQTVHMFKLKYFRLVFNSDSLNTLLWFL